MLKKLESYRKFVVALVGANGAAFAAIDAADLSTSKGIIAFAVAELIALGVYAVPNKP